MLDQLAPIAPVNRASRLGLRLPHTENDHHTQQQDKGARG
jgi:hypothetical protein